MLPHTIQRASLHINITQYPLTHTSYMYNMPNSPLHTLLFPSGISQCERDSVMQCFFLSQLHFLLNQQISSFPVCPTLCPNSLTVTLPPESSSKLSSNTFDTATPVSSKFTISCVKPAREKLVQRSKQQGINLFWPYTAHLLVYNSHVHPSTDYFFHPYHTES